MNGTLTAKMQSFLHPKNKRDASVRNNIALSAVLKVVGLVSSLVMVPVTLHYLKNEEYGIWLTISSILYWFSFFDVGLGNGMRNYLTESISKGDFEKGRSYLSTTFVLLGGIALLLGIVFFLSLAFLDLTSVFNTTNTDNNILRECMFVAVAFTLVLFVVKNIGYVFVALQHYALNDLLIVGGNVLSLAVVCVLSLFTSGNLLYVVLTFTSIPVVVFLLAAIPIFRRYPSLRPSLKSIDWALGKQIASKGIGFFFIQITSCLIIYGSSNLFITNINGPEAVTTYNIAYKYFNLLAIGYTMIVAPLWNAYTDAYVKGEMSWIDRSFRRALRFWMVTVVGGLGLLAFSQAFYHLWVDELVSVPWSTSIWVFAYICCFNLNNCTTSLVNGLNKIRVQIYTSVVFTLVYLALVYLLGPRWGSNAIIGSMAACYLAMSIIHLYQCRLLIRGKAKGVWDK